MIYHPHGWLRYTPEWLDVDPYPQIIDGVERCDGPVQPVIDPSTGTRVATWATATDDEIEAAVAAARRAFDRGTWAALPAAQRAETLDAVAALIRGESTRFATLESLDTGKCIHG